MRHVHYMFSTENTSGLSDSHLQGMQRRVAKSEVKY